MTPIRKLSKARVQKQAKVEANATVRSRHANPIATLKFYGLMSLFHSENSLKIWKTYSSHILLANKTFNVTLRVNVAKLLRESRVFHVTVETHHSVVIFCYFHLYIKINIVDNLKN